MGEEVSVGEPYWECSCGRRWRANPDENLLEERLCPQCGSPMMVTHEEQPSLADTDETLRVELQDMAKLAQEGVDVGVSGEWDTSGLPDDKPRLGDD